MMPSRVEVNFTRLAARMEEMADAQVGPDEWRFEKYLAALRRQLGEMGKEPAALRPSPEQLRHYRSRVDFLEQYWAACRAPTVDERSSLTAAITVPVPGPRHPPTGAESVMAAAGRDEGLSVRHRPADIAARTRSAVQEDVRRELLGGSLEEASAGRETSEVEVVRRQESLQERLAEGMVDMARSLKETVSAAGRVVRADITQLDATSRQAEANTEHLTTESKRLTLLANASAAVCSCTVWLALILVTFTFVSMVVFIRLFPKR